MPGDNTSPLVHMWVMSSPLVGDLGGARLGVRFNANADMGLKVATACRGMV